MQLRYARLSVEIKAIYNIILFSLGLLDDETQREKYVLVEGVMGNCSNRPRLPYAEKGDIPVTFTRDAIHAGPILDIQSLCTDHVITASDDKRIALISYHQLLKEEVFQPIYFMGHKKAVTRVCAPTERKVVSASRDLSLKQVGSVTVLVSKFISLVGG